MHTRDPSRLSPPGNTDPVLDGTFDRRQFTIEALALLGLVGVAGGVGVFALLTRGHQKSTPSETKPIPDSPEAIKQAAQYMVKGLAAKIIQAYEEAPPNERSRTPYGDGSQVTLGVDLESADTQIGTSPGLYILRALVAANSPDNPDPSTVSKIVVEVDVGYPGDTISHPQGDRLSLFEVILNKKYTGDWEITDSCATAAGGTDITLFNTDSGLVTSNDLTALWYQISGVIDDGRQGISAGLVAPLP